MLDQRGQLLRAAVGFAICAMPPYDRALWALRTWFDSTPGPASAALPSGCTVRASTSS